jgi:hypothetical protein
MTRENKLVQSPGILLSVGSVTNYVPDAND